MANVKAPDTSAMHEQFIWARRHFNDWRKARYSLDAIDRPHWTSISGGVGAVAPRPLLHGYDRCDAMLEGDLAHSCAHGRGLHRILVCVTKKDNDPRVYAMLAVQAGSRPPDIPTQVRPTFRQWVRKIAQREDVIGNFARDLTNHSAQVSCPRVRIRPKSFERDIRRLRRRLHKYAQETSAADDSTLKTLEATLSEYVREAQPKVIYNSIPSRK